MLLAHLDVFPRPVAWTADLGSKRTWAWLHEAGYLHAGQITLYGRAALILPVPVDPSGAS
jgi:hypothetical protein